MPLQVNDCQLVEFGLKQKFFEKIVTRIHSNSHSKQTGEYGKRLFI